MKAKGEQTQASGHPDMVKSWDLEHSPKIIPLPTQKHVSSLSQKTKIRALSSYDLETVCICQSWEKHTHLKRNKLINCYKLLIVTKTKIKELKKKQTQNLFHLTKHALLQDWDRIALLFPNTWDMQAINKQVQDVHWYISQTPPARSAVLHSLQPFSDIVFIFFPFAGIKRLNENDAACQMPLGILALAFYSLHIVSHPGFLVFK